MLKITLFIVHPLIETSFAVDVQSAPISRVWKNKKDRYKQTKVNTKWKSILDQQCNSDRI